MHSRALLLKGNRTTYCSQLSTVTHSLYARNQQLLACSDATTLYPPPATYPYTHGLPFNGTVRQQKKNILLARRRGNGRLGDHHRLMALKLHLYPCKHPWAQAAIGIGDTRAQTHRPPLGIEGRVDHINLPGEKLIDQGIKAQQHGRALYHHRQIVFGYLKLDK